MKRNNFLKVVLFVLIFSASFLFFQNRDSHLLKIESNDGILKLNVEFAQTAEEKMKGLMYRESLEKDRVMLFVYPDGSQPVIWMKNMKIPLDIFFVGADLKINHIEENALPCVAENDKDCLRYKSDFPSTYVLEASAGLAEEAGIQVGNVLTLPN